jgi:transcriptional regulator with XRE-family HTH domain
MTGLELKLRRTARRVKAKDLARQMGVSNTSVSHIESRAIVTAQSAERYLAALATFPDVAAASEVA